MRTGRLLESSATHYCPFDVHQEKATGRRPGEPRKPRKEEPRRPRRPRKPAEPRRPRKAKGAKEASKAKEAKEAREAKGQRSQESQRSQGSHGRSQGAEEATHNAPRTGQRGPKHTKSKQNGSASCKVACKRQGYTSDCANPRKYGIMRSQQASSSISKSSSPVKQAGSSCMVCTGS